MAIIDPRTQELLSLVVKALEPSGLYAIGGAFAMHAHGYARYTSDVDVFVQEEHRIGTLRALRNTGLTVEPVFAPHHYHAYLPQHNDARVRIDVMISAGDPELSAIEFPDRKHIAGFEVNVFPIGLVIAAKFYADRPEDYHDISAMLNRGMFDPAEVTKIISHYDADAAKEFAVAMIELQKPRTPRKRPTRK